MGKIVVEFFFLNILNRKFSGFQNGTTNNEKETQRNLLDHVPTILCLVNIGNIDIPLHENQEILSLHSTMRI